MPPSLAYQAMAADDAWVTVKKNQSDCLRQYCEHCPDFRKQLQDLSDARTVVLYFQSPSGEPSKKRKALQVSGLQGASQPSHSSHQPESQEPRLQLSSLSTTSQWKNFKRPPAKGVQRRPQQKVRKIQAVEWFIRNTPKAYKWRKRQTELDLNTVEQYE